LQAHILQPSLSFTDQIQHLATEMIRLIATIILVRHFTLSHPVKAKPFNPNTNKQNILTQHLVVLGVAVELMQANVDIMLSEYSSCDLLCPSLIQSSGCFRTLTILCFQCPDSSAHPLPQSHHPSLPPFWIILH
jgi:hypothetical protein